MVDYGDFLDDLKSKLDIVEVISSYLPLKKSGRNFLTLCPFHQEKTPSFVVSREKNLYHCFGCGKGGSVFNFVMEYDKVPFNEAIQILAKKYGISVPVYSFQLQKKEKLYQINETIARFFSEYLKKSKQADKVRQYLTQRKITENSIDKYLIGYSPSEAVLASNIDKLGYTIKDLLSLGLIHLRDNKPEDTFKDRLLFPIYDSSGRVCGFAGRSLSEKIAPKYLNIGENILFKKSKLFYGFSQGKKEIADTQTVILVEGYFDVISMQQQGFFNTIGLMGTGLTVDHVDLLKKWVNNLVIMLDNDEGGVKATIRAIELLKDTEIKVKICAYPAKDPDELTQKYDQQKLKNLLSDSISSNEFIWKQLVSQSDLSSVEAKSSFIRRVINFLLNSNNIVMTADIVKRTAELTLVKEDTIYREIERQKDKSISSSGKVNNKEVKLLLKNNLLKQVETYLMSVLIKDGELFFSTTEGLTPEEISDPVYKKMMEKVFKYIGIQGILHIIPADLDKIFDVGEMKIASGIMLNEDYEVSKDMTKSMVRKLRMIRIQEDINILKQEINSLKETSDFNLTRKYLAKMNNLISYLKELQL